MPARLYNRPLVNNYRIAAIQIELVYLFNINDWKTCQADALGILNALNRTGYVMTGAGCCMPFVLLIGLTAEMLPDT